MDISKFDEHERFVLNHCVFDGMEKVIDYGIDSPDWFFVEENKLIFTALLNLHSRQDNIDIVTLAMEAVKLKNDGAFMKRIADLFDCPFTRNIKHYLKLMFSAKVFFEAHKELKIIDDRIVGASIDEGLDILQSIADISTTINFTGREKFRIDEDGMVQWFNDMIMNVDDKPYLPTRIKKIDEAVGGGLYTSKLYTIAARPGCGKTALATNMMYNIAREGVRCLYITMELTEEEIVSRMMATATGIKMNKFSSKEFNEDDFNKLSAITEEFQKNKLPVTIDSKTRGSWSKVRSLIRTEVKIKQLKVVFIDYVQQFSSGQIARVSNKREDISFITNDAKQLALELGIVVVICSQLNRAMEQRQQSDPMLSDLKESGSIEQDSDVVMLLWDQNQTDSVRNHVNRVIKCKIGKNRSGGLSEFILPCDLATNKFEAVYSVNA